MSDPSIIGFAIFFIVIGCALAGISK